MGKPKRSGVFAPGRARDLRFHMEERLWLSGLFSLACVQDKLIVSAQKRYNDATNKEAQSYP